MSSSPTLFDASALLGLRITDGGAEVFLRASVRSRLLALCSIVALLLLPVAPPLVLAQAPPSPSVSGLSQPASGPAAGGTQVTITGSNFSGATAVDFGTTAATHFTVNSAGTQIAAVSPAGSGTVDVTVTTPAGSSSTSAADQYTYEVNCPAADCPGVAIQPSNSTVGLGDSLAVTVEAIAPSAGLGAWTADIAYDPALLTVSGCKGIGSVCNATYGRGEVRVTGASTSGLSGTSPLATITFQVTTTAAVLVDRSALGVTVDTFTDPSGNPISATPFPGTVTVTPSSVTLAAPTTVGAGLSASVTGAVYGGPSTALAGVALALSATQGALAPASVTSSSDGGFAATFTAPTTTGKVTLTAAVPGTSPAVQGTATLVVTPGLAAKVTLQAPSGVAVAGTATVSGKVSDQYGNGVPGASVDLSTSAGAVSPSSVTTGSDGTFQATFTAPSTPQSVTVTGTVAGTTLQGTATIQVTPVAPTLASIAPTSGPAGTSVTLSGSGFGTVAGAVYFTQGTTTLKQTGSNVSGWTDTSVSTTVPSSLAAGSVSVAVYNNSTGLESNTVGFTVTVTPVAPTLSTIAPTSGPAGTSVTLSGSGFGTVAGAVYFTQGTTTLKQTGSNVSGWTDTSVSTTVPSSLAAGSVSVAVYNNSTGLESNTVGFTVTGMPAPTALSITTTSLPGGTVGTAYTATLAATGGTTPYTWSVTSGNLPAGLTLDASTGVISGTPTAAGTSNFTVQAADSSSPAQTAPANLSITVSPMAPTALSITTTSLPGGTVGTAYTATLAATGGTTPYTWSVTSGNLPAGLTLDASTGVISGTPTAAGTSNFTVQAADGSSPAQTATANLALIVAPAGVTVIGTSSGSSSNPNVPATAGGAGSSTPNTTVSASGGTGTVTVGEYNNNPRGATTFSAAGVYFDAVVAPGSTFTTVTLTECNLNGGNVIYWWNGTAWAAASNQSFSDGCVTLTVTATTSPNLSQLTGTVFAVGTAPTVQAGVLVGSFASGSTGTGLTMSTTPLLPCPLPLGLGADGNAVVLSGTAPTTPQVFQLHYIAPPGSGVSVFALHTGCSWRFVPTSLSPSVGVASIFVTGPETLVVASNSTQFSDVPSNYWARSAIESLTAADVINGFPNGTFEPNAAVTRAEFVKMLVVALGLAPGSGTTNFTDVPADAWYAPYVSAAVQAGLVTGVTATTFDPGAAVTRQDVAVLLARALRLSAATTLRFSDNGQIASWATGGVEAVVAAGYMNGFPNGTFQPTTPMTRAQAAKVLALVIGHRAP
jgi:hypothetical protein